MESTFHNILSKSTGHKNSREANAKLALENPQFFNELFRIAFSLEDKNHFKACWALELILEKSILKIKPHLNDFLNLLPKFRHDSALRSISKIVLFLTESNTLQLEEDQERFLIENCLDWLIKDEKVATKAYAIKSLYNLSKKHPWISTTLSEILEQDYSIHSPAYKAAARNILKKIKKNQN